MAILIRGCRIMTKICGKCRQEKPFSEFAKCRSKKNGLQSWCKICKREWKRSIAGQKSVRKSRATLRSYLQQIFRDIKHRCSSPKYHAYHRYGGRGIKCLFNSSDEFINYIVSILKIDPRGLQIDRIDNDGNYEPGNIRFVTHKENCNNRG